MAATPESGRVPAPRLSPLPPAEWPREMRDAIAALRPPQPRHPLPEPRDDRPKGLNALGTFARHPDLARAFHTFNGHILFGTTLTPRQRELLVLRVASRRRCAYEWVQHVVLSRDLGMDDDEITAVRSGAEEPRWSVEEALLIRAADELLDDARVSDATWTGLAEHLDPPQLMDVVFTVGAYDLVAMAFNSFGVRLDEDLARHAEVDLDGNGLLFFGDE